MHSSSLGSSDLSGMLLSETRRVQPAGVTVATTFVLCWAPFLRSSEAAAAVATRLAPIGRGLFEDHVANVWCASSLAIKWKQLFAKEALARAAAAATLAAAVPSMAHQILHPSRRVPNNARSPPVTASPRLAN